MGTLKGIRNDRSVITSNTQQKWRQDFHNIPLCFGFFFEGGDLAGIRRMTVAFRCIGIYCS